MSTNQQTVHLAPTITVIRVPFNFSRSLVEMRDAGKYDHICPSINDKNFPVEYNIRRGGVLAGGERELVLVCFHREIDDCDNSAASELLRELDKLSLQPEGPPELYAVGEHHPDLQREFHIVARRQVWRSPSDWLFYQILRGGYNERALDVSGIRFNKWLGNERFLASRKPAKCK